jgi:hypothetical protein
MHVPSFFFPGSKFGRRQCKGAKDIEKIHIHKKKKKKGKKQWKIYDHENP